jgi:hypothetical protein
MDTIKSRGDAKVAELHKYPRNPRRGDIPAIQESLRTLGQYKPIVVNIGTLTGRPDEILAGNHTHEAATILGWETIAAVYVDVDETTAAKIVLADNRTSDLATYDPEQLLALVQGMSTLDGTGFTPADMATLADDVAPAPVEKNSTPAPAPFHQWKDWEERDSKGMMLDYDLDEYWVVRDLLDGAAKRHGTSSPAETILAAVEAATGQKAPRP